MTIFTGVGVLGTVVLVAVGATAVLVGVAMNTRMTTGGAVGLDVGVALGGIGVLVGLGVGVVRTQPIS